MRPKFPGIRRELLQLRIQRRVEQRRKRQLSTVLKIRAAGFLFGRHPDPRIEQIPQACLEARTQLARSSADIRA